MKLFTIIYLAVILSIGCTQQKELSFEPFDFQVDSFDWDKQPYKSSGLIKDSVMTQSGNQVASWAYSYIGDVGQTLRAWDGDRNPGSTLDSKAAIQFAEFKAVAALPYIFDSAKEYDLVIVNEAHQSAKHRIFTTSLFQGLYDQGYRHFGMEGYFGTGDNDTTQLNINTQTGGLYPTMKSGYYTKEPQFGNMIREALRVGFKIFGYESNGHLGAREREINQAKNIQSYMERYPDQKVLLHCGFAHVKEGLMGGSFEYAMAARLQEYTGIDPLTIDQTMYAEKSKRSFENAYAQLVDVSESSVLINNNDEVFNESRGSTTVDIAIFHPRTDHFNRPSWMKTGGRKFYDIDFSEVEISSPSLVYAYLAGELIGGAVPYDVVESNDKKARLVLKKGHYKIVIEGGEKSYMAEYKAD